MGPAALILTVALYTLPAATANELSETYDFYTLKDEVAGTYPLATNCSLDIQPTDACVFTVRGIPPNCMSSDLLVKKIFSASPDFIAELLSSVPVSAYIQEIVVDECAELFSLQLAVRNRVSAAPSVMSQSTIINITISVPKLKAVVDIKGDLVLGKILFEAKLEPTTGGIVITADPNKLFKGFTVGGLIGKLAKSIAPSADISKVMDEFDLNELIIKDIMLKGSRHDRGFGVRFSFTGSSSKIVDQKVVFTILRLRDQGNWKTGVVIGGVFKNIYIAGMFKSLTSYDISSVPHIGTASSNTIKLLVSTVSLGKPLIPYSDPDIQALAPINKGLHMLMLLKFSQNDSPVKVRLVVSNELIEFSILDKAGISVSKLVEKFASDFKFIKLPPRFSLQEIFNIGVIAFKFHVDTKVLVIPAILPDPVVFIPGQLEMRNVRVSFSVRTGAVSSGGRKTGFDLTSDWALGNLIIPLNFSMPVGLGVYIAESRPQVSVPFAEIIKQFAISLLPAGALEDAVKKAGLQSFSIENPYVKITFGNNPAMKVSGTAVIGTWDKCKAEVMIGKVSGATVMASGIVIQEIPITKIVSTMTDGKINLGNLPGSSILDNTDVAVVMSSQPVPRIHKDMRFSTPSLANIQILDGVSLVGSFKFPSECGSEQFCKVAKRLLGKNAQLVLNGRLAVASVYLSATVPTEIQIFKGVNITDVGFEVEVGASRSGIGIKGSLKLKDPPLTFIGSFGQSTSGTYLQMAMAGMWKKPFGVNFLELGDLLLRVAVTPDPTLISALEIGGKGRLGKIDDPKAKPVEAQMYIGIDKVSPSQNYFMGKFSAMTMPAFLKAFAYEPNLPKPLSEIGFPKGLNASFALQSKLLPNGVSIPRGFYLIGVLKVLFFEAHSDIKIDLNGIFINLTVSPFKIGNGLVSVSGRSANMGPRIFVDIGWNPPRAFINIEGALTILGMKRTVNITVDHKGISFQTTGSFLNLFEAGLTVTTNYGSIETADFQVDGYFRQSMFTKLEAMVKSALDDYRKKADKHIGNAQNKLEGSKKGFDNAVNKLSEMQRSLENEKAKFDAAIRNLEEKKAFFESKKKVFDEAVRKMTGAQRSVDSKKKHVDDAVRTLAEKRRKSCPSACRRRRATRRVFLDTIQSKSFMKSSRIKRLFGIRIRIKNPIEIGREGIERTREGLERGKEWTTERGREAARATACAARKVARETCIAAFKATEAVVLQAKTALNAGIIVLEGAKVIVDKSRISMDAAKGLMSVAQVAVDKSKVLADAAKLAVEGMKKIVSSAKATMDIAKAAVEAAKRINQFGVMIAQKIVSGLAQILNIEKLTFSVKLSIANSGHFKGSMEAIIFGTRKSFSFDIKLRSISSMVESLLAKVKDAFGIGKKRALEESNLPALSGMKPTAADPETVYILGGPGCKFYEEISEIALLILNDTEDVTDIIRRLRHYRYRVALLAGRGALKRINEIVDLGDETVHSGLDAVKDLVIYETDMSETELKELLAEVQVLEEDPCLKELAGILSKLLLPGDISLKLDTIHVLLKRLEVDAHCLRSHACYQDTAGPAAAKSILSRILPETRMVELRPWKCHESCALFVKLTSGEW